MARTPGRRPRVAGQRRRDEPIAPSPPADRPSAEPTVTEPTAATEPTTTEPVTLGTTTAQPSTRELSTPEPSTPATGPAEPLPPGAGGHRQPAEPADDDSSAPVDEPIDDHTPTVAAEPVVGESSSPLAEPVDHESPTPVAEPVHVDDAVGPLAGRRRYGRLPLVLAGVLAILVALNVALFAVNSQQSDDPQGTAALIAARGAVEKILSYDYTALDASFAAAEKTMTDEFVSQYRDTTARAVRAPATEAKAVVTADVVDAGVSSATGDRVEVIVLVNQATTSTRYPNGKIEPARVRVSMQKVGGTWKVDGLTAL